MKNAVRQRADLLWASRRSTIADDGKKSFEKTDEGGAIASSLAPTPERGQRYAGLDAWRGILLLFGIILHAFQQVKYSIGTPPAYDLISLGSKLFRMEGFYLIAGFLAALTLSKRQSGPWLAHRMRQLIVPLVICWFVMNPLGFLIAFGDGWKQALAEPYHLWFLALLAVFVFLIYLFHVSDRRYGLFRPIQRLIDRSSGLMLYSTISCALILLYLATLALNPSNGAPRPIWDRVYWVPYYFSFYFAGYVIFRARIVDKIDGRGVATIGFSLFAATLATAWLSPTLFFDLDRSMLEKIATNAVVPVVAFSLSLAILKHACSINRVPAWISAVSESSYTVYLIHWPVIMIGGSVLGWMTDPLTKLGLLTAVTFFTCWLIDFAVVKRLWLAGLLLNGRLPASRMNRATVVA